MKQTLSQLTIVCSLLAVAAVSLGGSPAEADSRAGARVVLPSGEVHDGWFFAAGDEVAIEGTINGDAYVAGGTVRVAGTVNGDLLVAGGEIYISGTVTDDIRAGGGQIRFSGRTGKNIAAAGGTVALERGAVLEGGLLAAGGTVAIAGTVAGEARISAGEATLTGTVQRDLRFVGKTLAAYPGSTVGGTIRARVEEKDDVWIAEGARTGPLEISMPEPVEPSRVLGFEPWHFWWKVLWALSLLATALFLALAFPLQLVAMGTTIASRPGQSALWGVLTFLLTPVVIILLAMTVVGIPLALFVLFLYLWLLYLTQLGLGVVLAHWLMGLDGRRGWSLFGAVVLGVLAVQVLTFIPYVRHLVTLVGIVFGLGALCLVVIREVQHNRGSGATKSSTPVPA